MTYGRTLKLENGDLYLDSNRSLVMIDGIEKVKQDITVILSTIRGEDYFNPNYGVDYFAALEADSISMMERLIAQALSEYKYIDNVIMTKATPLNDGRFKVEVMAKLITGETISVGVTVNI